MTAAANARPSPGLRTSLLHLGGLWTLACVWPLFDLLRHNAEFFVARGNTRGDVLILAFAFALGPPLVLAGLVWLAGRVRPALGWWTQVALVGALVGLIVLDPADDALPGSAAAAIALALAAAMAAGLLYARVDTARWLATVLSPAPLVALALFLVFSPVSKLVFDSSAQAAVAGGVRGDTPVVMVVFDELPALSLMDRAGRIDARRVPSFARLARDATWYRNATTVADGTEYAVPALLSGSRPVAGDLPIVRDYPHNLFTLLGGHYRFNVVEPLTDLCPVQLCPDKSRGQSQGRRLSSLASDLGVVEGRLLLPAALRDDLPETDRGWQGFGGGGSAPASSGALEAENARFRTRVNAVDPIPAARRFIAGIRPAPAGGRPQLDFAHLLFPHVPWRYLPDGKQYPEPGIPGLEDDRWARDKTLVDQGWERHLLQTGAADRVLGRILRRLRQTGIYDRALIVVVADHGVSFRPGRQRRAAMARTFPDIAGPPLIVKLPHQHRGRIDDSPVRTIDILPTIAKLLRVHPAGWRFDGLPFSTPSSSRSDVTISRNSGARITVPFATFVRERDRRLARQSRLLGRRDDPYALGVPDARLIGRQVGALRAAAPGRARVVLDDPGALARAHPGSPTVPAYVSGRASGIAPGRPIALALDGRIAATTRTYSAGGQVEFSAIVPPAALRRGAGDVMAYEIVRGTTLRPLARGSLTRGRGYRLIAGAAGPRLAGPLGEIAITPRAATGALDGAQAGRGGRGLLLRGWAVRRDLGAVADQVAIFAGERLVTVLTPTLARPDLVKRFSGERAPRNPGFAARVPRAALRCRAPRGGLRAFAIVGGRATELAAGPAVAAAVRRACRP